MIIAPTVGTAWAAISRELIRAEIIILRIGPKIRIIGIGSEPLIRIGAKLIEITSQLLDLSR